MGMRRKRAGRQARANAIATTLCAPIPLVVVVVLAAGLLVFAGLLVVAAPAQAAGFPDVSPAIPAYDAINFLSGAGIISGYSDGNFGPGDTLKRAQATKMLVLWKELPQVTGKSTFPDVDSTYRGYVEAAVAQGWITGFSDGRFRPYSTLTRQQMAIIMVRVMGWEQEALALSQEQVMQVLSAFSDWKTISQGARRYVAMAVSRGLFGGSNGCYMPAEGITRAQFCLVVMRAELSLRAGVKGVRSSADYPDKTRVVIDLTKAPGTVVASATPDGVLNIDYTGGAVAGNLTQPIGSAEVASVTATQLAYAPRTVRLSLQLGRYQSFRVMSLGPAGEYGYRIAVDVFRRTTGPESDGPPLICVDPGHGGTATGAIGVSGTPEKVVNLAMALRLADVLRAAGLRVMLTRETDCDVPLETRATMANTAQATLFVSIHNNASGTSNSGASGTETYYRGTKEQWDEPSRQLALAIQRNLVATLGSIDRGAKTHWLSLVVLTQTVMPAVLVEVGFMDNAQEEAKLLTPEYQQAAAQGIAKGIMEYLGWSTAVYTTEF